MENAALDRARSTPRRRRQRALPASPLRSVPAVREPSLMQARGYQKADLMAAAELGYHYLFSGAHELARAIFEGLTAIDPMESYFFLALGFALDRQGERADAHRAYERAAKLDTSDPRPDLNRAELFLAEGDRRLAKKLLTRGLAKAVRHDEAALENKARAVLALIGV